MAEVAGLKRISRVAQRGSVGVWWDTCVVCPLRALAARNKHARLCRLAGLLPYDLLAASKRVGQPTNSLWHPR